MWETSTLPDGAQTGKAPGRLIYQCKFMLNYKKLKNKQQDVSTIQEREHWPGERANVEVGTSNRKR